MKVFLKSLFLMLVMICLPLSAQNQSTTKDLQLSITPATLAITTASLPTGTVGVAYTSTTLTASGGVTPYVWTVCTVSPCQTNNLPAGMTLTSAGVLSGTPTVAFKGAVTFKVTDNSGSIATINIKFVPSTTQNVTAYNIKRGIVSGAEVKVAQIAGNLNMYDDTVPKQPGTTYFYVASALNSSGESINSNEAQAAF